MLIHDNKNVLLPELVLKQGLKKGFYIGWTYCMLCSSTIVKIVKNKHFCCECMVLIKMSFQKDL